MNKGWKVYVHTNKTNGIGNSKPIMMFSKDGQYLRSFSSAHEAELTFGISHTHTSQCCHSKRKSAGGYAWKFAQ